MKEENLGGDGNVFWKEYELTQVYIFVHTVNVHLRFVHLIICK